jgi:hypothetical protein
MWMHRMPKQVREKVKPRTKREMNLLVILGLPLLLFILIYPIVYVFDGDYSLRQTVSIPLLFFIGFNLWDTLVLDLIVFCRITPRFIIIQGTAKKDYREIKYHLISGVKGLIFSIIGSLVLGPIIYLLTHISFL